MNVPEQLLYTRDHEWAALSEGRVRVGITDYAQDALGDIVFVQLPEVGAKVQAGITFSEVESTKPVSDIYAPVDGIVVEVNTALSDAPRAINSDPYESGWLCVIEPVADAATDHLLSANDYRSLVGEG